MKCFDRDISLAQRQREIAGSQWCADIEASQQRAFIDFYEDRMVAEGYEWKQLMNKYLYEGDEPLAYSFAAGCKSMPASNVFDSDANACSQLALHLST